MKTKQLLLILVIGLAAIAVKLPTSTSHQALADDPPATDGLQTSGEDAQPLAYPALAEMVAEEPDSPDATAQLDDGTHGTYWGDWTAIMAAFQAGTTELDRNYGTYTGLWTGYIDRVAAARWG